MILSILTPAVPSRREQLRVLHDELTRQIGEQQVELLAFLDNKRRSVGAKRDALLRAARGDYIAFVDDDDFVSEDYVASILEAVRTEPSPDVVTFLQRATVNGQSGIVEFRLGNPNEEFKPGEVTRRNAWHVCAWRRSLAILSSFPDSSYGEDWQFASRLCALRDLKSVHIPRVLHHYQHSSDSTEAPPPQCLISNHHSAPGQ